jgi:alpha-N-arabinofuranosidase
VSDLGPFDLLDASATVDSAGGELCLAVVNRSRDDALPTAIRLDGRAFGGRLTAYEVNGADPTVRNSFEQPDAVHVETRPFTASGNCVEYTFPAHSVTVLRGQLVS